MSDLMLDVDQAGELKAAFRRGLWTNADIKRFSEGTMTAEVLPFVRGTVKQILPAPRVGKSRFGRVEHIIDLDVAPLIPDGWSYHKEDQLPKRACGEFVWDATKTRLHLSPKQTSGKKWVTSHDLKTELQEHTVFGANVLDYLLEHPYLIPDEWKGKVVSFWGTVYRYTGGGLVVRYLCWSDGQWCSSGLYVSRDWREANPALCAQV